MGRAWNNPVAKTSNNAIRTAANMPESGERAPASALTAVREKPPVTGKAPESALAILAAPSPRSSALVLMRCRFLLAKAWAMETLSTKPIKLMASAGNHSLFTIEKSMVGTCSTGNPPGRAPTTRRSVSQPIVDTNTALPSTVTMGISLAISEAAPSARPRPMSSFANQCLASHNSTNVAKPNAAVSG